jgi:hypothetical protein
MLTRAQIRSVVAGAPGCRRNGEGNRRALWREPCDWDPFALRQAQTTPRGLWPASFARYFPRYPPRKCYQWNRAESKGRFGALSAPNSAKNSAKFFDEMSIRLLAEDSSPQLAFWKPGRGQNAMRNRLAAEYQSQSPGKLERQSDAKPNALHPESLRQDVLWRARVEVV